MVLHRLATSNLPLSAETPVSQALLETCEDMLFLARVHRPAKSTILPPSLRCSCAVKKNFRIGCYGGWSLGFRNNSRSDEYASFQTRSKWRYQDTKIPRHEDVEETFIPKTATLTTECQPTYHDTIRQHPTIRRFPPHRSVFASNRSRSFARHESMPAPLS